MFLLTLCILFGRYILNGQVGKILLALKDKEDRVRFSGYDVANFKIFIFCIAAMFSAIGGAMFTLQVGFMSPSFIGIVPSIEMVIYAAVGGRICLIGAVYGTLVVNAGKTLFSESFPELWLFLMGALFIGVVMAFPDGLSGMYAQLKEYLKNKYLLSSQSKSTANSDEHQTTSSVALNYNLSGMPAESVSDKGN